MFEKLQEFMSSTFNYEVTDYAVYETEYKKSRIIPALLSLFGLVFIFYIVDLAAGLGILNFPVVLFLFVVLVLAPLALRKDNKYQALFVTPDYIIQRNSRSEFVGIKFDDIKSFSLLDTGITLKDDKSTVVLGLYLHKEDLEPIIDILEAKGKTFDSEKDYMIRPVEIHIKNNKITLVDLKTKTDLDTLYEKYAPKFKMFTPGFIDEIMFRNVNVSAPEISDDTNLLLRLDQFEVKDGHPENTKFDSITAIDGGIVFHNVKVRQLILQDRHGDSVKETTLENDIEEMITYLNNATISEWKTGKNKVDFFFATGVNVLKASLAYENVIIGWNNSKE